MDLRERERREERSGSSRRGEREERAGGGDGARLGADFSFKSRRWRGAGGLRRRGLSPSGWWSLSPRRPGSWSSGRGFSAKLTSSSWPWRTAPCMLARASSAAEREWKRMKPKPRLLRGMCTSPTLERSESGTALRSASRPTPSPRPSTFRDTSPLISGGPLPIQSSALPLLRSKEKRGSSA